MAGGQARVFKVMNEDLENVIYFLDSVPASITGVKTLNHFDIPILSRAEQEQIVHFDTYANHHVGLLNGDDMLIDELDEDPVFANVSSNHNDNEDNEIWGISINTRKKEEKEVEEVEMDEHRAQGSLKAADDEELYATEFRQKLDEVKQMIPLSASEGARTRFLTLISKTYSSIIFSCSTPSKYAKKTITFGPEYHITNNLWPSLIFLFPNSIREAMTTKQLEEMDPSFRNGRIKNPRRIKIVVTDEEIERFQHQHGAEKSKQKLTSRPMVASPT